MAEENVDSTDNNSEQSLSAPPPGDSYSEDVITEETQPVSDDTSSTDDANTVDLNVTIQELSAENTRLTERARLVDDFEADPQGVLQRIAERLGMSLVPAESNTNATQDQTSASPPQSFVDNISQSLPPEMQFMAPGIARATWIANQEAIRPFQEQQQVTLQQNRTRERDQIAAEMDASHPEWRQSISQMEEWHNFVRDAVNGGSMRHPKFGTLQEVLLQLATGNKSAVTAAASRMRDAASNATSTSSNQHPSPVDVAKQIREAKNPNDKFDIAFRAAMAEHGA